MELKEIYGYKRAKKALVPTIIISIFILIVYVIIGVSIGTSMSMMSGYMSIVFIAIACFILIAGIIIMIVSMKTLSSYLFKFKKYKNMDGKDINVTITEVKNITSDYYNGSMYRRRYAFNISAFGRYDDPSTLEEKTSPILGYLDIDFFSKYTKDSIVRCRKMSNGDVLLLEKQD